MALCNSHSGSHWLSLPLSGILWPPLAHYCSLISRIQSLIGSHCRCHADALSPALAWSNPIRRRPIEFYSCQFWQYFPLFKTFSKNNSLEDVNHPIPLLNGLRHEKMRVVLAAKILRLLCRAGQGRLLVATVPKAEPTSRTSWWGDVLFTSTGIYFLVQNYL